MIINYSLWAMGFPLSQTALIAGWDLRKLTTSSTDVILLLKRLTANVSGYNFIFSKVSKPISSNSSVW